MGQTTNLSNPTKSAQGPPAGRTGIPFARFVPFVVEQGFHSAPPASRGARQAGGASERRSRVRVSLKSCSSLNQCQVRALCRPSWLTWIISHTVRLASFL